jgi:hypothetical protein
MRVASPPAYRPRITLEPVRHVLRECAVPIGHDGIERRLRVVIPDIGGRHGQTVPGAAAK